MKTLKELKKQYDNDLTKINNYDDLKSLACNYIRMITWKKEKDLEYIGKAYTRVIAKCIIDIKKNGYDEALKKIKNDNLHKAYNIKYVYGYYGLDYDLEKKALKEQRMNILN